MNDIWTIILAAGESSRMKMPKMLLPYGHQTIIETVIANALASEADRTVLVLGCWKDDILKMIRSSRVSYCYNDNYKQGMLSSIKCGLSFIPSRFRAALILLGDQPMIGPELINKIISAFNTSGKGIIIPIFGKKHGHPIIIHSKYLDEIESINESGSLRDLIKNHPEDVHEIETDTDAILKDIDTYNDYLQIRKYHPGSR